MNIIEYDSEKLIQFYKDNDIEINEEHGYYGTNLKSFAMIENEDVVGAVTISKYDSKNFIEVIAVNKDSRGKGYGNILLNKGIEQLDGDIYVISKEHDFYLKNGFEFIEGLEYMISDNCQVCEEYNKTCFPKVMVLKRNKVKKMDKEFAENWLNKLKEYWFNKDIKKAVSLFNNTTFYQETPFLEPYTTIDEIRQEWQHIKDENIQEIEIRLLAIDGYIIIAEWILKQNNQEFDGIYEIKFNNNLECIYFKSWEMVK